MEIQPIGNLLKIPVEDFPLAVLSDSAKGFIGWGIRAHEDGFYNHFMWAVSPNLFVSQDMPLLHKVPMRKYMTGHRIKLWHNPNWTKLQKAELLASIVLDVKGPWYSRMYDVLQIGSFIINLRWLNIPGKTRICSDHADHLRVVDGEWEVNEHHSPPDLNRYFKKNIHKYSVYGVYSPDA